MRSAAHFKLTSPPESASGQPVGQDEPHGGPYQPELATPSVCGVPPVPNESPEYHLPGPDAVG